MPNYVKGRWKSFGYALKGVKGVIASGPNFVVMLLAIAVVVVAGIYYHLTGTEWALVTFAITLVVVAEALNTAIEKLTDMVQPKQDPRAGMVKDLASGGVLLACIGAAVIGVLVFGHHIMRDIIL
ncbi:diacylglycerol kinase family protein [soil metagenome]